MWSLFSTNSEKAGFRLQYMEVYNWGTFHDRVFKIHPQGNNSLLTGANASGKSTFIDALLTLLVPIKKDRFYNQSSGVEKKGDRTEESYVCGNYGNIQREGESSSIIQTLRDKSSYSVILASFSNTDQKEITLFQVRWFTNGELKKAFGIAHVPLEITKDFSQFDSKGMWKRRLEKDYNHNKTRKIIEFLEGPSSYAERITMLFGMRSTKALSLFNQVVGVKVLDDLDDFIRTNMLEEVDAESEYIQLRDSFFTLMDAKTKIEKVKEQIAQLTPIDETAILLNQIQSRISELEKSKEQSISWFAKKNVELAELELVDAEEKLKTLNYEIHNLREEEESLKQEERTLAISIERDEVSTKIKDLEKEIRVLIGQKDTRSRKLDQYNEIAQKIELNTNPSEETFKENRELANQKRAELDSRKLEINEKLRFSKNNQESLKKQIDEGIEVIQSLQKNKNNIAGPEAEIRENILEHIKATKEEVPFIGELMKLKDEEKEWELAIEKTLHNFAKCLIVPEKYYAKVNEYVNDRNLHGKITYQKFQKFNSLASMGTRKTAQNALINKLDIKPNNIYSEWLENLVLTQYQYTCVNDLKEFDSYQENAITKEGLIKSKNGHHEKDDSPYISRKENFVLGWDNKEKLKLLQSEIKGLQEKEKNAIQESRQIEKNIKTVENQKELFSDLFKQFTKYDDINWETFASQIQEKESQKTILEKTNNRVQALQNQLREVQRKLKDLSEIRIFSKSQGIFLLEKQIEGLNTEILELQKTPSLLEIIEEEEFEKQYPELKKVRYSDLKTVQTTFRNDLSKRIFDLERERRENEDAVKLKINAFKQPSEEITTKFNDWRADVSHLPDSTHLEFITEYQNLLKKLRSENLPKYEQKFNEFLQETITNKIGHFRIFFENWADTIKENIRILNDSLRGIDYRDEGFKTYIQLVAANRFSDEIKEFKSLLTNAMPNVRELEASVEGRRNHFNNKIEPLIKKLEREDWRKKVMEVRSWFSYKAEEFYKENSAKYKTYENLGLLSGGEKAQMTYTILGSAIAYQFGLTKEGLQSNSFRFIAIDEAFKAQDETKARYLIKLCKQLHLQLLVVTPSDNIHIVQNDISFIHFVERKEEKYSWIYDMPIEQFKEEKNKLEK